MCGFFCLLNCWNNFLKGQYVRIWAEHILNFTEIVNKMQRNKFHAEKHI